MNEWKYNNYKDMRINQKETEKLTYTLTVEIERAEANEKKNKTLRDYRKRAEIKGFRKGMAPMGLIEKMYGQTALGDAVNGLISDGLNKYIRENNMDLIGEPMPNEESGKQIDWEKDEVFEFSFDVAVRPVINLEISKDDNVVNYSIKATPEALKQYKADTLRQFGSLADTETAGEEDFMVVDFEQGDKKVEKSYISLKTMEAKTKKTFLGKKKGDEFEVDVVKCFPNEVDRASMLKMKKENFDASNPVYKVTVQEVKTFKPAEENQDLYDRLFGKDKVKDSESFDKELEAKLLADYAQQSEFRLRRDLIDYLVKKAAVELPENFLKKWLFAINEGKFTMEQIEAEFPLFLQDYRWQMIARKVCEEQKIEIKKEDLLAEAKAMTASQFAMYGMTNVPDEQLAMYAEQLLSEGKETNRIYEKCEENKVLEYVKGVITITDKEVTFDELVMLNAKEADAKEAKKAPAKKTAKKTAAKKTAKETKE